MAEGMAFVCGGRADAGVRALRRAVAVLEEVPELGDDPRMLEWLVLAPLWLRDAESGRGLIAEVVERVRREAAVGMLPGILLFVARDQATTDDWAAAHTSYAESIRLARETGRRAELASSLAGLAVLEARQGREPECRRDAAEAVSLCDELDNVVHGVWATQSVADLELGLGRPLRAIERYEAQAARLRAHGFGDVDLSPGPDLVEAYLRVGRDADAAATAADFVVQAEAKGLPWVLARAARCRGLLAEPGAFEAPFEEALVLHQRTPDAFERARTQLAYGTRLRHHRQRVRAREQLRLALETFDRLGARPWVGQAEAELAATGETSRRRDPSTLDDLTPQELQIARLLADGMTTREAAAAIFLSPKTVEYHLRGVYRKLGIHSREDLAVAMATQQHAAVAP
jgi:DNA-binding CsgD family transcriptional regulator